MGRVDAARVRVERAVERIERAVAGRRSGDDAPSRDRADDEQLRATLEAVRAEHAALQDTTRTVRTRLDRTIRRIEEILES
ncbi:hypothetical protein ABIE65_002191 [Constrictibacter sp. MBR-5]|jgi:hypothetical protein|uniref:hypothetical protein n=1 Tax=Constrictibacter sp. MBR-5 TaxID=3156467 RepID=UPI003397AC00